MSLVQYFSRESDIDQSTVSGDPDLDDDGDVSVSQRHGERSLETDGSESELPFPETTGAVSSGSSSLPDISESEDDPSLPLPLNSHLRDVRIRQGPYRPILSKYKVTVNIGKI